MAERRSIVLLCLTICLISGVFLAILRDNRKSQEESRQIWKEDAGSIYATAPKNFGIGTKNPSSPFSVFRNGLPMSKTGFAVAAFDPKSPDKGIWLGYDALGITGILGADSDGKTASDLAFWAHDGESHGERMRLTSTGSLGVGTSVPSEKVHVIGKLRVQGDVDCVLGKTSGGISCASDLSLTRNVRPIEGPLAKVLALRGVEFDHANESQRDGRHDIGLIAQDVERVFPTAVIHGPGGYMMVDHGALIAPLIEATKEINGICVERHGQEIRELKEQNVELAQNVKMMRAWICAKDPSAGWCHGKE